MAKRRKPASADPPLSVADKSVISVMRDWPLEPGDMLLLGPRSVTILGNGAYAGSLPDKHVLKKSEWNK